MGVSSDGRPSRENSVRLDWFAPELADDRGCGARGDRPTRSGVGLDPDYARIGELVTRICEQVDPRYTDRFLAAEQESRKLLEV